MNKHPFLSDYLLKEKHLNTSLHNILLGIIL